MCSQLHAIQAKSEDRSVIFQRRTGLYGNILIPTDGSELDPSAVKHGVKFAKEIGAKVTGVTVTEPFHLLSVKPTQLEYTPAEYKKHSKTHAEQVLHSI